VVILFFGSPPRYFPLFAERQIFPGPFFLFLPLFSPSSFLWSAAIPPVFFQFIFPPLGELSLDCRVVHVFLRPRHTFCCVREAGFIFPLPGRRKIVDAMVFSPLIQQSAGPRHGGRGLDIKGESEPFGKYMNRKISERLEKRDLFGVEPRMKVGSTGSQKSGAATKQSREETALAGLLSEFMQQLKELAEDKKQGSGGWEFSLPDEALLSRLGESAGMNATDLANLSTRLREEGQLSLPDFLGVLARHFERELQPSEVIAPETDLPLLAGLLGKMGLPMEQVSLISEAAVVADGRLDLAIFLKGLEGLEDGGQPITLTGWEAEQLKNMFTAAGVPGNDLARIFPDQQSPGRAEAEREFSREGLQSMLRQAIAAVESEQPQVELPAFFADLDRILTQAGFNDQRVGWSPAVQQTVEAMYRELLQSVDLARVQIEAVRKENETPRDQKAALGEEEEEFSFPGGLDDNWELAAGRSPERELDAGKDRGAEQSAAAGVAREETGRGAPAELGGMGARATGGTAEADGPKPLPWAPRLTPESQQQIVQQLSTGMLKGLNNNEHHLILKLYPRELGEVRVEMLVRDQQVSLAILTESSRIKEVVESNLGQFRENMERQGFTLGECMVSVDRGDDSGETWQRFLAAWKNQQTARRPEEVEELIASVMPRLGREQGFNIVV
jgi:flagellar hook-length control protein FliK